MRLTRRKAILLAALALVAAAAVLIWDLHARAPLPRDLRERVPAYWRTVFIGDADVRQAVRGLYAGKAADRIRAADAISNLSPRAEAAVPWLVAMLPDCGVPRNDIGLYGSSYPRPPAPAPPPQPQPKTLTDWFKHFFIGSDEEAAEETGAGAASSDALASIGPPAVPRLIEALADPSPEVRIEAVRALGNIADVRAIEPLRRATDDSNEVVRATAVRALGAFSDPRAAEALTAVLKDFRREQEIRLNAAAILDDLGGPARAAVLELLRSPDRPDRLLAATGLLRYTAFLDKAYVEGSRWLTIKLRDAPPEPDLLAALVTASADSDEIVAMLAIDRLREYRDPRVTDVLLAALGSPSTAIRTHAANGLAAIKEPRAVEPLAHILANDATDAKECEPVVRALTAIGDPQAVRVLVAAFKARQPYVRTEAVVALAALKETAAADAIAGLLTDEVLSGTGHDPADRGAIRFGRDHDLPVNVFAAMTLADLGDDRGAAVLVRALAVRSMETPENTDLCKSLMKVAPAAVGPLVELTADPQGAMAACRTLAEMIDPRAVPALSAVAVDTSCPGRRAAVAALGRSGDKKTIELLATLTDDPAVRLPALIARAQLGDRRALAPLVAELDACTREQAVAILDALGDLGDPAAIEPILLLAGRQKTIMWLASPNDPAHFVRTRYWHYFSTVIATVLLRLGDPRGVGMMLDDWAAYDDELHNLGPTPSIIWGFGRGSEYLTAPGQAAAEPLLAALSDKRKVVVRRAAEALVQVQGVRALEPLRQAFLAADDDGRWWIGYAVSDLDGKAVDDFLIDLAADPDPWTREHMVDAMASHGGPACTEAIRRATADPCIRVRFAAWDGLKRLTGETPPPGTPRHEVKRGVRTYRDDTL
jgi:HEAT repeat protein